ncbi:MAG: GNAT family N-acetyltransferase [Bacteroidota bacterium]
MQLHYVKYQPEELEEVRSIFLEYADFLQVDLCFQGFEKELQMLHEVYTPPKGCIILAKEANEVQGCVALKPIANGVCEMKRLYVKPIARGKKIGKLLVEELIQFAKNAGYKTMKLDTLSTLKEAVKMYRSMGFTETKPYVFNPLETVVYFELSL